MKMKSKQTILYILLAASVITSIIFITKTVSTQKKLEESIAAQKELQNRVEVEDNILEADSLLIKGQYSKALKVYDAQLSNKAQFNKELKLKIALTNKLQALGDNLPAKTKEFIPENIDSLQNANKEKTQVFTREVDSLNFALKKARVQVKRMRAQLQDNSLGAYVTFKSKKGNYIHYVGKVTNQKANGFGIAILDSGSRYEGQWHNNQRHGEGVFYWKDGEHYKGSYENDERNGEGTYYWTNGEKYVGHWKGDKRNGQGIFYNKKGDIITQGVWENDKLVEQKK